MVEKDWLAFGHRFDKLTSPLRKGQGTQCPIFVQWLDCVHQMIEQNESAFEFTVDWLAWLAYQVYSCRFGTFLSDSRRERIH